MFLFLAARRQHVVERIQPWLRARRVVLCDRYTDATIAYQGYGRGLDPEMIRELNLRATGGVLPDLTLLFDLDPAVGFRRIGGRRLDHFERQALAFHRRVRRGYLEIQRPSPSACASWTPTDRPPRWPRRCRPSSRRRCVALEAIRDQPRAVELLRRALAGGRVASAYAFVGPTGSGRMTTARAFAKALLCESGQACGTCHGCALVARGQHPDLHVLVPTPPETNPKGARTIRIGAVRELERQASLRPALAGRRVFVLDEADRMTDDAPQAFLKFLEEPPPAPW